MSPPLVVLGVSRSGTTLLRVDPRPLAGDRDPGRVVLRSSARAPPRPHGLDAERFLDDVARIPTIRDWGLNLRTSCRASAAGMPTGGAIAAIFEAYADGAGKPRWGDKTPMYMRHLALLERLFPDAQYVHLLRDGRDAALSFLEMPQGTFTRTWAHPRRPARFACLWRKEVWAPGRSVGASGRVAITRCVTRRSSSRPRGTSSREICAFAEIPFDPAMLDYADAVDVSAKPHQQRLLRPPTTGVRSWREDMSAADTAAFERVAGDLLEELGYEVRLADSRAGAAPPSPVAYGARLAAWNASASAPALAALAAAPSAASRCDRGTLRPLTAIRRPLSER